MANGAHIINISAAIAGSVYPCSTYTTLNNAIKRAEAANVLVVASSGNYSNPTVTCPAALMKSYNPALHPHDLRTTMQSTADDLLPAGFDNKTGHGRINARAALDALVSLRSPVATTGFLVADNFLFSLPMTTRVSLLAANPTAVTFTTEISPAVTWLTVASTGGASPQVTLVGSSIPPPGTHGIYSTTVILTAQTLSGNPLGTRSIDVYFRYLAQVELFYLPLVVKQ